MMFDLLLWSSLLGSALFAGTCLAFWGFVMPGLENVSPPAHAATAMNAINTAFVRGWMLPLFILTGISHLGLGVIALAQTPDPGTYVIASGAFSYLLGMFVCTLLFNVPLNQSLLAADPNTEAGYALWVRYQNAWGNWNVVRTLAGTMSFILLAAGTAARY